MKKLAVYKVMTSNFGINYSLAAVNTAYRTLGMGLTNSIINNTAGPIFTGGVTVEDLKKVIEDLGNRNISVLAAYAIEDVDTNNDEELAKITNLIMESIKMMTEGGAEGNFAQKLTAFIGIEDLKRMSRA